jgi:hypothetical protein
MMVKEIPPAASDRGPQVGLIKFASGGLYGHDFANFVKRAGHPLAEWVRNHPAAPGETLVHLIALGSTEKYGPNRNSDGYPNAFLRDRHHTFEKYARFYRDHKANDPAASYGLVKKAYHHPELERVELIVALNRTKEAADRNGGRVADYEHDLLESGRDLAVSQAVKIAWDECVACGNRARHRGEYCGPEKCSKYGGCRDHLGRVFDDGFHLFVQNPNGDFYDISNVTRTRGADRTAFATGKVAVAAASAGGAAAAEALGLVVPDHVLDPHVLAAVKAARELAAAAKHAPAPPPFAAVLAARGGALTPPAKSASAAERRRWVSDAAHAGLVLPPAWWLAAHSGAPVEKCAAFFGDSPVSAAALLDHPRRCDLLAAQSLCDPDDPAAFAALAPTPRAAERAAWKAAALLEAPRAAPQGPPDAVKEAAVLYAAYLANAVAAAPAAVRRLALADAASYARAA